MGLFSFGSKSAENIKWTRFDNEQQLSQFIEESNHKTIMFFKHSTRCSISSMAKSRLENDWDLDEQVTPIYVDLIANRNISSLLANKFAVQHESPQIILVRDGISVYDTSHNQISVKEIKNHL
ncbi:MAG: bacillithiol system protein YtxJ [Arenicella sp.]|jgi:bacillithiol system protein YtxJ